MMPHNLSDHDLLIRIYTQLMTLVDRDNDKEHRIRKLEKWLAIGIGGGMIISAVFTLIFGHKVG